MYEIGFEMKDDDQLQMMVLWWTQRAEKKFLDNSVGRMEI